MASSQNVIIDENKFCVYPANHPFSIGVRDYFSLNLNDQEVMTRGLQTLYNSVSAWNKNESENPNEGQAFRKISGNCYVPNEQVNLPWKSTAPPKPAFDFPEDIHSTRSQSDVTTSTQDSVQPSPSQSLTNSVNFGSCPREVETHKQNSLPQAKSYNQENPVDHPQSQRYSNTQEINPFGNQQNMPNDSAPTLRRSNGPSAFQSDNATQSHSGSFVNQSRAENVPTLRPQSSAFGGSQENQPLRQQSDNFGSNQGMNPFQGNTKTQDDSVPKLRPQSNAFGGSQENQPLRQQSGNFSNSQGMNPFQSNTVAQNDTVPTLRPQNSTFGGSQENQSLRQQSGNFGSNQGMNSFQSNAKTQDDNVPTLRPQSNAFGSNQGMNSFQSNTKTQDDSVPTLRPQSNAFGSNQGMNSYQNNTRTQNDSAFSGPQSSGFGGSQDNQPLRQQSGNFGSNQGMNSFQNNTRTSNDNAFSRPENGTSNQFMRTQSAGFGGTRDNQAERQQGFGSNQEMNMSGNQSQKEAFNSFSNPPVSVNTQPVFNIPPRTRRFVIKNPN